MNSPITFVYDIGALAEGLLEFKKRFDEAMAVFCEQGALKLKTSAQLNRTWTDRTGNARQSLNSDWEQTGYGYQIALRHGMEYGFWLEMANEKRYAIIMPTIQRVGYGEIMPAFQGLLDRLGG